VAGFAELLDMLAHIREVTGKPVGIKAVVGSTDAWAPFFEEIVQRGAASAPDFITVDGGEGCTGAAPMPLIDLVGLSIRDALVRMLDLRGRRFCQLGAGRHVFSGLYSGAEVQQEHLPHWHHHT